MTVLLSPAASSICWLRQGTLRSSRASWPGLRRLDFQVGTEQLAVKTLLDALRLGVELLAGHLHADFDFQADAVAVDLRSVVLVSVRLVLASAPWSSKVSVTTRTSFQAPGWKRPQEWCRAEMARIIGRARRQRRGPRPKGTSKCSPRTIAPCWFPRGGRLRRRWVAAQNGPPARQRCGQSQAYYRAPGGVLSRRPAAAGALRARKMRKLRRPAGRWEIFRSQPASEGPRRRRCHPRRYPGEPTTAGSHWTWRRSRPPATSPRSSRRLSNRDGGHPRVCPGGSQESFPSGG